MGQKVFTDHEVKTLRHICVLYNANVVAKSTKSERAKRVLKSLIKYKMPLSDKEIEIIQLICREYTSGEIASKIGVSTRRIENIRGDILKKTNSKNSIGIFKFAIKNKIFVFK